MNGSLYGLFYFVEYGGSIMASSNTNRKEKASSNDLFTTPVEALDAIWSKIKEDIYSIRGNGPDYVNLLEPCAGMRDIADYIHDRTNWSVEVTTNELYPVDGYEYDYYQDFLSEDNSIGTYDLLVANVPYNRAKEFILKGFDHAPIQWHFLRLSFLEGQSRFMDLFSLGKLSDVYVFTYRVSCKKGIEQEATANSVSYAWYRWDKNYCGQPTLHWLTKANLK